MCGYNPLIKFKTKTFAEYSFILTFLFAFFISFYAMLSEVNAETQKVPYSDDAYAIIDECVETSIAAKEKFDIDLGRQCISIITNKCLSLIPGGMRFHYKCAGLEKNTWEQLRKFYYSHLVKYYKTNSERANALPPLVQANADWEKASHSDCEYLGERWGRGTNNKYDRMECGRDIVAERALKYRRWLRTLEVTFLYRYK